MGWLWYGVDLGLNLVLLFVSRVFRLEYLIFVSFSFLFCKMGIIEVGLEVWRGLN